MNQNEFKPVFERLWRYFNGKEDPNPVAARSYFEGLNNADRRDFESACDYLIRSKRPDKFQFPTPAELADRIVQEMSLRDKRETKQGIEKIITGEDYEPEHAIKCAEAIERELKIRRGKLNGKTEPKYYPIFDQTARNYRNRATNNSKSCVSLAERCQG